MGERRIICPICGKEFVPQAANSKYCSTSCRQKGNYQRRREWEKENNYLEAQREKMQQYRQRKADQEEAEHEAAAKKAEINKKRQNTRKANLRRNALLQAAEQGDTLARLTLAAEEHPKDSAEYWEAFKNYDLDFAAKCNKKSVTTVNGISIHDPAFALAVSMSIEETKHIFIRTGLSNRITN